MTQIVSAACKLNKRYWGLPLGYRVLNLDRTEYSPFTLKGVLESAPGYYTVVGGVEAPSAGGCIIWGEIDRDLLEWPIEPRQETPDPSDQIAALAAAVRDLANRPVLALPDSYVLSPDSLTAIRQQFGEALASVDIATLSSIVHQLYALRGQQIQVYAEQTANLTVAGARISEQAEQLQKLSEHQNSVNDSLLAASSELWEVAGRFSEQRSQEDAEQAKAFAETRRALSEFLATVQQAEEFDEPLAMSEPDEDMEEYMIKAAVRLLSGGV